MRGLDVFRAMTQGSDGSWIVQELAWTDDMTFVCTVCDHREVRSWLDIRDFRMIPPLRCHCDTQARDRDAWRAHFGVLTEIVEAQEA